MRHRTMRTIAATSCAVALLGLGACGEDDASGSTDAAEDTTASEEPSDDMTSEEPSDDMSGDEPDMAAQLVGPGCADYAEMVPDGAGSVQGMAQDPVATAASNNPLLKTLVAAVSGQLNPEVNLVDVLNGGEFTVFAPVDDAFAALPKKTVTALGKPANAEMLSGILTYHVVEGQIPPSDITGSQTTVQGDALEVTGSGDDLKVNDANVVCGGVQTANATVYLIDSVLTPPM